MFYNYLNITRMCKTSSLSYWLYIFNKLHSQPNAIKHKKLNQNKTKNTKHREKPFIKHFIYYFVLNYLCS